MPVWLFIFLAVIALLSAFGVVVQRNPVHCLLALAVNLIDIGVIFIGLGAVTVGLLQIIIYVGAIMVLFLFVIWLLNLQAEAGPSGHLALKFFGSIGAAALAAELSLIFSRAAPLSKVAIIPPDYGSITQLGQLLFSEYSIAFEVTSILLLAAIVGAIGLARRIPVVGAAGGGVTAAERAPDTRMRPVAPPAPELQRKAG
ncbi:MAG TPA: NADH-quinone oxidoreductase subunit J [Candidatus Binataceae bacterium]|nr:NADH-quinone oxidoreductase subunit J [Candidatus Binataceae bacterium]